MDWVTLFGLFVALCLAVSFLFARRWAKKRNTSKAKSGEYALPVNPELDRLALFSMSLAGLGLCATLAFVAGFASPFVAAGGFSLVVFGLIGCFVAEILIRSRKKTLPLGGNFVVNVNHSLKEDVIVVSLPNLKNKLLMERWVGNLLGGTSLVCFLVCLGYLLKYGFTHFDPSLSLSMRYATVGMVFSLFGLFVYYGFSMAGASRDELALLDQSRGRHFVLSPWGIECSIGLIEGEARTRMRNSAQGVVRVAWSSVATWSVERSQQRRRGPIPAYYKLLLKPENTELFILRSFLAKREREILDFARRYLDRPMELRDSAYFTEVKH